MQKPTRAEFDRGVREHHAAVYRSALRITKNEEDALDVTQQVFLRWLEGGISLEGADEPRRVLRWMAARTALTLLRGAQNRRRKETDGAMRSDASEPPVDLEQTEVRGAVRELARRLPEELQLALTLRFQEDMTYRAMGETLSCSEPSAHDRVKRAVEKLRGLLTQAGFGAAVVGLPGLLAEEEAIAVPAALEGNLLALGGAAGVSGGALLAGGVAAVLLVSAAYVGVQFAFADDAGASETTALSREVLAESKTERPAPPEITPPAEEEVRVAAGLPAEMPASTHAGQDPAPLPTGTVKGRVADLDGHGLADVEVVGRSWQRSGKASTFAERVFTDEFGNFELAVPVTTERGTRYLVLARRTGYAVGRIEEVLVQEGKETEGHTFALEPRPEEAPGEYDLTVRVLDEDDSPVIGARVEIYRLIDHLSELPYPLVERWRPTDGFGAAVMAGEFLGRKLIKVSAHDQGYLGAELFHVVDAQPAEVTIVLERGASIAGRAETVDGEPAVGLVLMARAEDHTEVRATVDSTGHFELRGLKPGKHDIMNDPVHTYSGPDWTPAPATWCSPFLLPGIEIGRGDLFVTIKRKDDARDVGTHMAEIHGTVRNGATGEPVELMNYEFEYEPVPDLSDAALRGEHLPFALRPFYGQTMADPSDKPSTSFHRAGLRAGTWYVIAHTRGFAPAALGPIRLQPGEIVNDVVLELHVGATVSGTVRGPDGKPVVDAFVFMTGTGKLADDDLHVRDNDVRRVDGQGSVSFWPYAKTDAEGHYSLLHVATCADQRVAAVHPAYAPALGPLTLVLEEGKEKDETNLTLGTKR